MTMLDRMRRHKNWLKWSLAIVVVAFVLLYIPNFLRNGINGAAGAGSRDVIASVDGRTITVGQFRRAYQQQMQAYRRAYGGNIDDRLLKQMGIDRRILQQMIDEEAGLAEARRLGISTSDAEVRARILALPAFQENGQFIGEQRYVQLLQAQRPPLTPADFENNVRRSLTVDKLRQTLTDWITVPDKEVEQEYRRRNDKV
jgi:peptidyl-prolyl cis-trans isomerase D